MVRSSHVVAATSQAGSGMHRVRGINEQNFMSYTDFHSLWIWIYRRLLNSITLHTISMRLGQNIWMSHIGLRVRILKRPFGIAFVFILTSFHKNPTRNLRIFYPIPFTQRIYPESSNVLIRIKEKNAEEENHHINLVHQTVSIIQLQSTSYPWNTIINYFHS